MSQEAWVPLAARVREVKEPPKKKAKKKVEPLPSPEREEEDTDKGEEGS